MDPRRRLLLLSNSTNHGEDYLDHASREIAGFLGPVGTVAFIPYAVRDLDRYGSRVAERFSAMGLRVVSVPCNGSAQGAIGTADAVFVGGGNTFLLIDRVCRTGLLEPLRRRVDEGIPYMGASAGTVIAGPTMMTTNDMPIVHPPSFDALGLVPFQINCHYLDPDPESRHMGETRDERIREYHGLHDTPVIGLREGAWLRVERGVAKVGGHGGARVFLAGRDPLEVGTGQTLPPGLG